MRVSTSLNVYARFVKEYSYNYEGIMDRAIACGFRCFDFSCGNFARIDSFYTAANWRDNVKRIQEYAQKRDVEFFQSHASMTPDDHALIRKSIEAAALVGASWTVLHPWELPGMEKEDRIARNVEIIRPFAEFARKHNIGLAIENMAKTMYWYGEKVSTEGFCDADELIPLVDQLNAEFGNVGVCWDTGHANLSMESQYEDIIKLGQRLKVTHIADNKSQGDDHMPPFYGTTDFGAIMKALKEIEYQGTFNFETHYFTNGLPDELVDEGVKLLYRIGRFVCKEEE